MTIKTLIYSSLSLGIVGGATVGGYFIFKPETSKKEAITKTLDSSPENPTNSALAAQENRGESSDAGREVSGQTTARGTSNGQSLALETSSDQNQTSERRDGGVGASSPNAR